MPSSAPGSTSTSPTKYRGDGIGFSMEMDADRLANTARLEPGARRRALRRDRVARGVRRARGRDHGAGGLRRGDAPIQGAGDAEPARPVQHRAGDHPARDRRAEAAAPPPHAARRRHLVPGVLRAGRGERPRLVEVHRGARRRPLRRQRAEDLEHARPPRQLVRAAGPHRSRRAEAPRDLLPPRRHDAARRRSASARHDHRREGVQRDLLHRRAGAEGRAARPDQRGLARRDDDARLRARHRREPAPRPAGEDPRTCWTSRRTTAQHRTRCSANASPACTSRASCSSW